MAPYKIASLFLMLVFSQAVLAQEPPATLSTTVEKKENSPGFSPWILGWKSYNTVARFGELNDSKSDSSKGRRLKLKQEFQGGYKWSPGWGAYVQNSQTRSQYKNEELNKWASGDPSVTLLHPDFFNNSILKVGGSVRAYIPVTDRSKDYDTRQYAYYLTTNYSLKSGHDVFNILIPRWFVQNRYADTDTTFYAENRTVYTNKFSSWGRWGVGQWMQYELHSGTSPGMAVDLIPQFDYLLSSKIFLGPRLSMPIYVKNSVYDSAKQVSLENAYFEFYFQASL